MPSRVSQVPVEVVSGGSVVNLRVSQVPVEVLAGATVVNLRVSQVAVEIVLDAVAPVGPMAPLVIPGVISPSKANLKKFDAVGEAISPFTGSSQQQWWQDQHWELDLMWPEMTWAQYAPLDAWSGALHGKLGTFLWGPPLATGPRGSAAGTPLVNNAYLPMPGLTSIGNSSTLSSPFPNANYYVVLVMQDTSGLFYKSAEYGPITVDATHSGFTISWSAVPSNAAQYWLYFGTTAGAENAYRPIAAASMGLSTLVNYLGIVSATIPAPHFNLPGSNTLNTKGWSASRSGLLLPGDFFQLTANDSQGNAQQRLYQYINPNPLASDANGDATLDIFPAIREMPTDSTPLVLTNPTGTFRLKQSLREAPARKTKTFAFEIKAREAI